MRHLILSLFSMVVLGATSTALPFGYLPIPAPMYGRYPVYPFAGGGLLDRLDLTENFGGPSGYLKSQKEVGDLFLSNPDQNKHRNAIFKALLEQQKARNSDKMAIAVLSIISKFINNDKTSADRSVSSSVTYVEEQPGDEDEAAPLGGTLLGQQPPITASDRMADASFNGGSDEQTAERDRSGNESSDEVDSYERSDEISGEDYFEERSSSAEESQEE